MKPDFKILVHLLGGAHWVGGMQYTRNLLRAVSSLPELERPQIILKIGRKARGHGLEDEFSLLPGVTIDGTDNPPTRNSILSKIAFLTRKLTHRKLPTPGLLSDQCRVSFPAKSPDLTDNTFKVYWVPDFQYKFYPQYFPEAEIVERDNLYKRMFEKARMLVVSSVAVQKDFERLFPNNSQIKVRILNFHTIFTEEDFSADPNEVCRRYQLPEKFAYVPNQF